MKNCCLAALSLLFISLNAQVSNNLGVWVDHLPYSSGIDVEEFNDLAYVATEQALFIYNLEDKSISRVSKVNGLSDVGLTDIAFSEKHRVLLIGYENGNLDIYDNGEVRNYPDIRLSGNYSGLKRINHIHIKDDIAYIATNFGILAYSIPDELILDTYIIGPDGSILAVEQTASSDDTLYAATELGLYKAALADAKFFFQNWYQDAQITSSINHLTYFNDSVFVNLEVRPNKDTIKFQNNGGWDVLPNAEIADNRALRTSKGALITVNNFSARAYDKNFSQVGNFNFSEGFIGDSLYDPQNAVIGTSPENFYVASGGRGLYYMYQIFAIPVTPNSPPFKGIQNLGVYDGKLFVSPGGYDAVGTPQFNNAGFYQLEDFDWTHFTVNQIGGYKDIIDVVADPTEPNRLYASAYGTGIIELERAGNALSVVRLINEANTNGAFPSIGGNGDHRVADLDADPNGNIWFGNSLTDRPLGVIRPDGSVESFSLGAVGSGANVLKIMATTQNQVWLQSRNSGIIVAQLTDGDVTGVRKLGASEGNGNLPSETVLSFAEDQDGEIWIGTNEGLAVLFSPENIFEPNRSYDASIIVIDEDGDGNGERVLGSESISDIKVDGSNKKWFATTNSGVFYTSENGREQLARFSKENSPLPSNNIIAVAIDPTTGMVYFGSDQGIVSYQGQATEGVETMTDVFAYPNPVKPGYEGPILIRGLVTNAQVKITDIEGNLVFETVAEGGQAIWSGRRFDGQRVKSGVYLAYITDDLGANTEVTKILVVN